MEAPIFYSNGYAIGGTRTTPEDPGDVFLRFTCQVPGETHGTEEQRTLCVVVVSRALSVALAASLAEFLRVSQPAAPGRPGETQEAPAPACTHTPPCVRGTAGYAQQHPGPYGTLPDAFYEALGEDPRHG